MRSTSCACCGADRSSLTKNFIQMGRKEDWRLVASSVSLCPSTHVPAKSTPAQGTLRHQPPPSASCLGLHVTAGLVWEVAPTPMSPSDDTRHFPALLSREQHLHGSRMGMEYQIGRRKLSDGAERKVIAGEEKMRTCGILFPAAAIMPTRWRMFVSVTCVGEIRTSCEP